MTLNDLPEGLFAAVNRHANGTIYLSVHSGGSAVLPLSKQQAQDLGLALLRESRALSRPKP